MPRVFVPSMRLKPSPSGYVPQLDIAPIEKFGEVVYLATPGNAFISQAAVDDIIKKTHDFQEDDIILLSGDMIFAALALGEMAMQFNKIRVLRWNSRDMEYYLEEWDWNTEEDEVEHVQ